MLTYIRRPKDKYLLRGEPKKVRLTQGMVSASRILKPVVLVQDGDLLAGSEVFESIEATETVGSLMVDCGGDIPLAYRVATLATCIGDALNVSSWCDNRQWSTLCVSPPDLSADDAAKYRKQACAHLGLPETIIPTVRNTMLPQADLEDLCGLLRGKGMRFSTAAIETEIRSGTVKFTPALAEFGVTDPAVADRKKRHAEDVCQPLLPKLLHMQHLLGTSPHALGDIKALVGVAIRKGFTPPHLAVGMAFYVHGLSMESSAKSMVEAILGVVLAPMMQIVTPYGHSPNQVSAALAVVFSEAGTLDDHHRLLMAAINDWDKKTEKLPA